MPAKLLLAILALAALGAGGYYLMMPEAPIMPPPTAAPYVTPPTGPPPISATGLPAQSESLDDFAAAIDADLQASASAVGALDTDIDTSVSAVQSAGASSNLYDPSNL